MEPEQAARLAREALDDKKAIAPIVLDVRATSGVTDFYVIAAGNSGPHLKALVTEVCHRLDGAGARRHGRTGGPETGWIVLDYLGIVVHVFTPERRAYYALEDLWSDAPRLP